MMMPVLFLGHGNPMFAIEDSIFGNAWALLGKNLPRPKAILCISAHWYEPKLAVTHMDRPRTIHDFGGFPRPLFEVQYPALGEPELAETVANLTKPKAELDHEWGLDHGTWSVLRRVYPEADIPVVQLSVHRTMPPRFHYELGAQIKPLRREGILIVGSGNVVHNLRAYDWQNPEAEPYVWAREFNDLVKSSIIDQHDETLINYSRLGHIAELSIPTPDHYLPFLTVLGARDQDDEVSFPVEGYDGRSMSMLAVQLGST